MAAKIEQFLLTHRGWVKASQLCNQFGVPERQLRAVGDQPGLCTEFAISGDKGFRHVACATPKEFERCYHRLRQHGISELVRAKRLKLRRELV